MPRVQRASGDARRHEAQPGSGGGVPPGERALTRHGEQGDGDIASPAEIPRSRGAHRGGRGRGAYRGARRDLDGENSRPESAAPNARGGDGDGDVASPAEIPRRSRGAHRGGRGAFRGARRDLDGENSRRESAAPNARGGDGDGDVASPAEIPRRSRGANRGGRGAFRGARRDQDGADSRQEYVALNAREGQGDVAYPAEIPRRGRGAHRGGRGAHRHQGGGDREGRRQARAERREALRQARAERRQALRQARAAERAERSVQRLAERARHEFLQRSGAAARRAARGRAERATVRAATRAGALAHKALKAKRRWLTRANLREKKIALRDEAAHHAEEDARDQAARRQPAEARAVAARAVQLCRKWEWGAQARAALAAKSVADAADDDARALAEADHARQEWRADRAAARAAAAERQRKQVAADTAAEERRDFCPAPLPRPSIHPVPPRRWRGRRSDRRPKAQRHGRNLTQPQPAAALL